MAYPHCLQVKRRKHVAGIVIRMYVVTHGILLAHNYSPDIISEQTQVSVASTPRLLSLRELGYCDDITPVLSHGDSD